MRIRSGWTRPVTQRPYFGSASTTVWPAGDDAAGLGDLSARPNTSETIVLRHLARESRDGQREHHLAAHGETSDIAFTAATAPHVTGSSTTGGKKVHGLDDRQIGGETVDRASSAASRPTSRSAGGVPAGWHAAPPGDLQEPSWTLSRRRRVRRQSTSVWVCSVIGRYWTRVPGAAIPRSRRTPGRAASGSGRGGSPGREARDAQVLSFRHARSRARHSSSTARLEMIEMPTPERTACLDRLGRAHLADDPERVRSDVRLASACSSASREPDPCSRTNMGSRRRSASVHALLPTGPAWMCRPTTRTTRRARETLADLRREPMIFREQGSGRGALEHALGEANVDLPRSGSSARIGLGPRRSSSRTLRSWHLDHLQTGGRDELLGPTPRVPGSSGPERSRALYL